VQFSEVQKCRDLTLNRVKVILVCISGQGLPTSKSEKLFVDVRTDIPEFSKSIGSSPGDELKMNIKSKKSGQKHKIESLTDNASVCLASIDDKKGPSNDFHTPSTGHYWQLQT